MSRDLSYDGRQGTGWARHFKTSARPAGTCSASIGGADRCGTRSTGCPTARQVQKKLGPAWTERGRPPAGYFTKRTAEDWLRDARRGAARDAGRAWCRPARRSPTRPRSTCATSSTTAAASRRRSAATARSIEAHLLPAFGERAGRGHHDAGHRAVDRDRARIGAHPQQAADRAARDLRRARDASTACRSTRRADVEKFPQRSSGDIQVFSPEEVWALVRAAGDEQDAAIYPDRGVHRPAHGRAARAALARRRLRGQRRSGCGRATPAGR